MKRLVACVVAGMMVLGGAAAVIAAPQDTLAARGTVTAISVDALTVSVKYQPMKFIVDDTTDVVAPGGGTMALRGHTSIQGSTDIPTLCTLVPGYLPMPPHEHAQDLLRAAADAQAVDHLILQDAIGVDDEQPA